MSIQLPTITDIDIRWASKQLGLKEDAFYGIDGNGPRTTAIKLLSTIDVSACPGSGKTTLLVAKLAVLAQKWPYRTHGICVLSHTNIARHEIEKKLGNTVAGHRLLSYPHFVGTIHGFVDEFLAIPWLRSRDYTIRMIDTEIAQRRRFYSLPKGTQYFLSKKRDYLSLLSIKGIDFNVGTVPGLKSNTETYKAICGACKKSIEEGYFCYEEMFLYAHQLLNEIPDVVNILRDRFPLLLIDEAQDNSKAQAEILKRIFLEDSNPSICQRFGDENQAIFNSTETDAPTGDLLFPNPANLIDLPTSYRFGQSIANLSSPLALNSQMLVGVGPQKPHYSQENIKHTIFIFSNNTGAGKVLEAFAKLIASTFPLQEISTGIFKAVGQVHRSKKTNNFPFSVSDYWNAYDPEISRPEPKPRTFIEYMAMGIAASKKIGESSPCVKKVAEAILRVADLGTRNGVVDSHREKHRYIKGCLKNNTVELGLYNSLIELTAIKQVSFTKSEWETSWQNNIKKIVSTLVGRSLVDGAELNDFLKWSDIEATQANCEVVQTENIHRFTVGTDEIKIHVGSVHSIKGETHTATLVLETFWYNGNLHSLYNWLTGKKRGGDGEGVQNINRLKIHYVAMTRPSHLLCLAMKKESIENIEELKSWGWNIIEI